MSNSFEFSSSPDAKRQHIRALLIKCEKLVKVERKTRVYGEVVKKLNTSREEGLPFQPAMCFEAAYESIVAEEVLRAKSVNMLTIWQLVQAITGEDSPVRQGVSKKMSLVIAARCHLQRPHDKHIQTHITTQALVDTAWQQIYFCLRTGYYEEAREIARSTPSTQQFAPHLTEWIATDGMVSTETAAIASKECEKMLTTAYDDKKLLLYTIISGSPSHIERILRDLPTHFNTIEDLLWFKLACIRDVAAAGESSSAPYSLDDLQAYLNKFEPSYYTKNGEDPLAYPYVLLLSVQLLPAILYLSKERYLIEAVHIAISLVDHSVLSQVYGSVMDANAEVSSMIREYGSRFFLRHAEDLQMTVEYYAQAAVTVGGGWSGKSDEDQQRQRNLMLKELLSEILLQEDGISFLLGARGSGEDGQLVRFFPDSKLRHEFLIEAAHQCQEAGLYDKLIEIQKRVGAFSAALEIINKCLSEAICSLSRGSLDGRSRTSGLIRVGNDVLQTYGCYPQVSLEEKKRVMEQDSILRELEAILLIHQLARQCNHLEALSGIPFLHLDPRVPDATADVFHRAFPYFQSCVPDLLRVALTCLDNVPDKTSRLGFLLASNMAREVSNSSSYDAKRQQIRALLMTLKGVVREIILVKLKAKKGERDI